MRLEEWVDGDGWSRRALVRDTDSLDDAQQGRGISQDPPDIEQLDWNVIKKELHNELVRQGLFSLEDVRRQQNGLQAVVLRVLKHRLMNLYK